MPLKYLSEAKLSELREAIAANRERYQGGRFTDLERDNGWAVELNAVAPDYDALSAIDGVDRSPETEIANSLVVHKALGGMTPALAREERIWVRLCHIECMDYSRSRWLVGCEGEALDAAVAKHLFAPTLTGIRDDNALSRLWWNVHVATIADPDDPKGALLLILKTADIRSNFVERTGTAARRPLARGIIRLMRNDPWITSSERAFRQFMIELNREGGGILFEALAGSHVDDVLRHCAELARAIVEKDKTTEMIEAI